ncbi:6488_t:CDS:2, partial [Acaulospora morrowiae]
NEYILNLFNMTNPILGASMVVGPVLGYFDQIRKFRATRSSSGFSLDTPGILLISRLTSTSYASISGRRFDITLLYQSIAMISVQIWLLFECIRFRIPTSSINNRRRWFWNWYTFEPYMVCLASLVAMLSALGIESTVPMPQAWQNYKNKSVIGFRWARTSV